MYTNGTCRNCKKWYALRKILIWQQQSSQREKDMRYLLNTNRRYFVDKYSSSLTHIHLNQIVQPSSRINVYIYAIRISSTEM